MDIKLTTEESKNFLNKVSAIQRICGMTDIELAVKASVSVDSLRSFRYGQRRMDYKTFNRICQVMNFDQKDVIKELGMVNPMYEDSHDEHDVYQMDISEEQKIMDQRIQDMNLYERIEYLSKLTYFIADRLKI